MSSETKKAQFTQAPEIPRDVRYDYVTCAGCGRPSQNIDTGSMPSGERVCGFCLRLSFGRSFAWLRASWVALRGAR